MKPSKFSKKCQLCERPFWAIPSKVKAGKDKYCSLLCYGKSLKGKRLSLKTEFQKGITKGDKNVNWLDDKVGYDALHDWVRRWATKPKFCDSCGEERKLHWANVSGEYRRDLQDFRALCPSCHKKYDWLKIRCKVWHPELSNISLKAKIGSGSKFGSFVDIGDNVIIGNDCKIQTMVSIPPGVELEDEVFVGPGVNFANDKYPMAKGEWKMLKTLVKKGAIIGMNVTVGPGIIIGKQAVIGMGSVVHTDVPDGEVWVGSPAKFYKKTKDIPQYAERMRDL